MKFSNHHHDHKSEAELAKAITALDRWLSDPQRAELLRKQLLRPDELNQFEHGVCKRLVHERTPSTEFTASLLSILCYMKHVDHESLAGPNVPYGTLDMLQLHPGMDYAAWRQIAEERLRERAHDTGTFDKLCEVMEAIEQCVEELLDLVDWFTMLKVTYDLEQGIRPDVTPKFRVTWCDRHGCLHGPR